MFDRLIEIILASLRLFQFWAIVAEYEKAVVLRLGRYSRTLPPGPHLVLPFAIETVMHENVVPEVTVVGPQSLTTKDQHPIVLCGTVMFSICDIKTFLLCVEGAEQVVVDAIPGVIGDYVLGKSWDELRDPGLGARITKLIRRESKKWGVEIINYRVMDLSRSRSYRLWQEAA